MDDGQSARPPRTARPRPRLAQPRAWSGWLFPGSAVTSSPSMPGSITWSRTRSGFPGMHRLQRGLAVCGLDDREPIRLEVAAQHGPDMRFVVDDEYPAHDHLIARLRPGAAHDDVVAPVRCADTGSRCCCISCCR